MPDLNLDGIVKAELAKLARSRAVLTTDVSTDRFRTTVTTRLKGPFILTGYADYAWKGKQWKAGARLSARW